MTLAALLVVALAPVPVRPADPWVGERVFPGSPALQIRDADRNPAGGWSAGVGTVLRTDGEWAEVYHLQDPGPYRGWVRKDEVVKLADAARFFTAKVEADAVWAYMNRASAWQLTGSPEKAVDDLTEVIKLRPWAGAYNGRGLARAAAGDFAGAAADFAEAVRLAPDAMYALNNLAWLRATCPDDAQRDGKAAVELAAKACDLSGWKLANNVDTLAAAHAEAGGFEQAVKYQKQALDDPAFAKTAGKAARDRLARYEAGKPYREDRPAKK